MTSITSNMHQKYDEVQKELNSLSKNEFKQMIKERKTTEAKKTFFFFVLSISFLSFALLLLIPLILFNKLRSMTSQGSNWKCNSIKNTIIWYSEKCKLSFICSYNNFYAKQVLTFFLYIFLINLKQNNKHTKALILAQ